MEKLLFLIVSVSLIGSVWGCSNNDKNDTSTVTSQSYTSDEATKRGDVVFLNKVYNFEKFDRFLANLENKKADSIRITAYTDEGDPIFKDLQYDGKEISYTYDDSNDKFGGSKKGIRTDICSKVSSEKNAQGEIEYTISGCKKSDSEISYFLIRLNEE